jgi:hypothetical protein
MRALVSGKARVPARTLLARAGGVWMWPRIAPTEMRGAASVPIAADVARFWITRLQGPEANDSAALRYLGIAAQKLNDGDEAGAQTALDASGLTRLSGDGAVLMRAVAGSLRIGPLDLPWRTGQDFGATGLTSFVTGAASKRLTYKALIQWRNPRDRRSWMRSPTWCSPIG